MLLSKPKKCYKSVSKTDLMTDQEKDQEEDQKVDIFAYEEMNITQDSVRTYHPANQYLTKEIENMNIKCLCCVKGKP